MAVKRVAAADAERSIGTTSLGGRGGAGKTVALVGLMGTGKSTIGRILAARLGRPFLDNDVLLRQRFNASAEELQEQIGLAGLHRLEAEVLAEELSQAELTVINAAASTVVDPVMRARLHDEAIVVWLRADAAVLADRVAAGGRSRPSLTATPLPTASDIASLADQRHDAFAAIADLTIDTTSEAPERSAERIIDALAHGSDAAG